MKPERASRQERHCWTHGVDDGYASGSQSGVQGYAGGRSRGCRIPGKIANVPLAIFSKLLFLYNVLIILVQVLLSFNLKFLHIAPLRDMVLWLLLVDI